MLQSPFPSFKTLLKVLVVLFAIIGFVLVGGYGAVRLGLTNTKGVIDTQTATFVPSSSAKSDTEYVIFPLEHAAPWIAFRQAVAKDVPMINKVSKETGIPPRLLVAILVPEQMRLFYSDRPLFKRVFEPLKVLGSQSQFSWGIFGIKEDTAKIVEANLTDTSSPYYLGQRYEQALSFGTSTDIDSDRFTRITDEHNHLYSYRYAALYVAQIEAQWKKAGFPINDKPEVIATLWNLGFTKSKPHANPSSGGAAIDIDGKQYSFGELAREFYYSDEMIELFPVK
jgi:hypothetical protein